MKKGQIYKKISFVLITIIKIEIATSHIQIGSSNNTKEHCIFQNIKNVSTVANASNSSEPCCPEGFVHKENSFGDHCIPEHYLRLRANFGECYFCKEVNPEYNETLGHPDTVKYTYPCKNYDERCRETCKDDHTCQGSCYKGYDWCPARQQCLRDNLECNCGPNSVNCNNSCVTTEDYNSNKEKYEICESGDCVLKGGICPKAKIGCHKKNWVCGNACKEIEDFTKFRRCNNRLQSDHNCIPMEKECMKDPHEYPASTTGPEKNMQTLKFIIIICVIFLVFVIVLAFLIRCVITTRKRKKEILFCEDNPEYGMVQSEYTATQVCDENEYYGVD